MAGSDTIKQELKAKRPDGYDALVKRVIQALNPNRERDLPDPNRIHIIDDGDYQGTRLYIIAETGYQPDTYWSIFVDYGSCSGCDTFQENAGYKDEISDEEVTGNWTMMLHMVQSMRLVERGRT